MGTIEFGNKMHLKIEVLTYSMIILISQKVK